MIIPRPWTFVYCKTCGHNVRVAYSDAPTHEGHANLPDGPELVCLDVNDPHCNGTCPLSNLPHVVMDTRLEQSGLQEVKPRRLP